MPGPGTDIVPPWVQGPPGPPGSTGPQGPIGPIGDISSLDTGDIPVWDGTQFVGSGELAARVQSLESSSGWVPTSETEAILRASIAAMAAGDTLDLGGLKHTLSSKLVIPAGRKIANFDFAAGAHTAIELAAGALLTNGRSTRLKTGGATIEEQSNIVVAGAGCRLVDVDPVEARLACVAVYPGATDVRIARGTWTNTSARTNACAVYGMPGGNGGLQVEGIQLASGWAAPEGLLLQDHSRARIVRNRLKGLRQLPIVTLTGWTLQSGNIYRTADRTDGDTGYLKNNGVLVTPNTSTPTAPGSNEWGFSGGFVYLNLGGTDPNSRTITSGIVGGYAATIYALTSDTKTDRNVFAHNDIEDCDGFGIYLQLWSDSVGNATDHNTLKSVVLNGGQHPSLPFAAIALSAGLDSSLCGDTVEGTGTDINAVIAGNGAHGQINGLTARGCSRPIYVVDTSVITAINCRGRGCDAGFYGTAATTWIDCDSDETLAQKIVGGVHIGDRGAGTPEGVVTAEPGSTYHDTTNGAVYRKGSGSSTTGWVAM